MVWLNNRQRFVIAILVVSLPGVALFVSGCEDFQPIPAPVPVPQEAKPEKVVESIVISSSDKAIPAVYEYLLEQAKSHEAKLSLADFYTVSDNWMAELVLFQDGSSNWVVTVDMSEVEPWEWAPYWQQASWNVFRDGRVIPSHQHEGNALRIEAELQELSLQAASQSG